MLEKIHSYILDICFPPRCPHCGAWLAIGDIWCKECFSTIYVGKPISIENREDLDAVYVLAAYEGGMQRILYDIKFNHRKGVNYKLAPFFASSQNLLPWKEFSMVVPVPVSEAKRKERGYNQVDIIFKKFIESLEGKWKDILYKIETEAPMYTLNKEERLENIAHSFHVKQECISLIQEEGESILLLDDIYTTGATLQACARVLREKGAKKITALTLASGAVLLKGLDECMYDFGIKENTGSTE